MYRKGKYLQKMYVAILVAVNCGKYNSCALFSKLWSLVLSFASHCYGHAGIMCRLSNINLLMLEKMPTSYQALSQLLDW